MRERSGLLWDRVCGALYERLHAESHHLQLRHPGYCLLTDTCVSHTCGDGQYFDQGECKCKCGANKVMCGGTCVSDVCESIYYFDQDTCTCACLNGGARCPTDDPRGACCYPTYVCYESTCYPPG